MKLNKIILCLLFILINFIRLITILTNNHIMMIVIENFFWLSFVMIFLILFVMGIHKILSYQYTTNKLIFTLIYFSIIAIVLLLFSGLNIYKIFNLNYINNVHLEYKLLYSKHYVIGMLFYSILYIITFHKVIDLLFGKSKKEKLM